MSKDKSIGSTVFLKKLEARVTKLGGPAAAARKWGAIPQNVSNAMSASKLPNKAILDGMGYEPIKEIKYRYKPIEDK